MAERKQPVALRRSGDRQSSQRGGNMPKPTITTEPMSRGSQFAARVSFATSAAFIALLGVLHVLKPEIDPSWRFISEYELGDYGWLMRLAFILLAISSVSLAVAITSQIRTVGGYLGLVLLMISAVGMALAGIFVTDPIASAGAARSSAGRLHELGAMLDLIPFAGLLINWSLARNQAWSWARPILNWTAWLPLIGTVVFVASMAIMLSRSGGRLGPDVPVGWPNRIMILFHCAWLMSVALCAMKVAGKGTSHLITDTRRQ
jgi:hypothetical protein